MPFFRWSGIDLNGNDQRGTMVAHSVREVEHRLFCQDIALLSSNIAYPNAARRIGYAKKTALITHLATLVESGIYIDQALELIVLQEKSPRLKEILQDIFLEVQQGNSFSLTLKQYPTLFDTLALQLIESGQMAGRLPQALRSLARYYEQITAFSKQLQRALMMPLITTGFFLFVALIIFIFIMPTFAVLFTSFNQELPWVTRFMLNMSDFLGSHLGIFSIGAITAAVAATGYWYWSQKSQPAWLDSLLWQMPLIGPLLKKIYVYRFIQSLALLMEGTVPIKGALETVCESTTNTIFKQLIDQSIQQVIAGTSLDKAFALHPQLFGPEIIAYIRIGQETGTLGAMLKRAAGLYEQQITKSLDTITTTIQPLLMIILGIFIAGLIVAVYLPIFSLSYAIG